MNFKRITIISGHYGSGKTNIALNLALDLKKRHENTALADIDIVNPYFRSKDSEEWLNRHGVKLICSPYANSNVDIPALPQEIYSVTDDKSLYSILDVGGDERGALALGRVAYEIAKENNYEMLCVVNKFRPLTSDTASTLEIMREIEDACKLKFTGIINNSNLGAETTAEEVLSSVDYAKDIAESSNLPVVLTTAEKKICDTLRGKIKNLYPLEMRIKV